MSGDDGRAQEAWLPESVLVTMWREEQLLNLGFDVETATRLAGGDTDVHRVAALLAAGCSHELAAQIEG